jgi:hypothetical protein
MAWYDLVRSINKACRILNLEFTEKDMPDTIEGLVKLSRELWGREKGVDTDRWQSGSQTPPPIKGGNG